MITPAQVTPAIDIDRRRERARQALVARSRPRVGLRPLKDVLRVAASGIGRGLRQTGHTRGEWDISGTCEAPRPVELNGAARVMKGGRFVRANGVSPYNLLLWTRCRRCQTCARRRRNLWAARAREEVAMAARTWFATFTLSPANHTLLRARASARLHAGGTDLQRLPPDEADAEVMKEYGAEVTKWLKRVRKNTGARLRYILVQESHKSGYPHFHALIHEVLGSAPIRHAALCSAWTLGFTKFKLIERDVKACWYVTKYLTKGAASRVRASLRYGTAEAARILNDALRRSGPTWPACTPPFLSNSVSERKTDQETKTQSLRLDQPTHRSIEDNDYGVPNYIQGRDAARAATKPPGSATAYPTFAGARACAEAATAVRPKAEALRAFQALGAALGATFASGCPAKGH